MCNKWHWLSSLMITSDEVPLVSTKTFLLMVWLAKGYVWLRCGLLCHVFAGIMYFTGTLQRAWFLWFLKGTNLPSFNLTMLFQLHLYAVLFCPLLAFLEIMGEGKTLLHVKQRFFCCFSIIFFPMFYSFASKVKHPLTCGDFKKIIF